MISNLGLVVLLIGSFFILVIAFQKSAGWGIALLLLGPILWPFFVFPNWNETKFWFFVALSGGLIQYVAH